MIGNIESQRDLQKKGGEMQALEKDIFDVGDDEYHGTDTLN